MLRYCVVSKRNVPETRQTVKDAEYRALSDFRKCIHDYLDFSDRTARAAGIEPRQYQLLLAIRATSLDSEPSVGTLAQHLRIRHHSAVELIDRAGRNGFVKRERSANGSNVLVRLTSKGHRVLERAVAERLEELQSAGPSLVDALRRLLGFKGNSRSKRK